MKCPKCDHKMRVTHSYKAGSAGETKRLFCDKCLSTAVVAAVIVDVDPGYGQGASTLAKKIENGDVQPILKEKDREQ